VKRLGISVCAVIVSATLAGRVQGQGGFRGGGPGGAGGGASAIEHVTVHGSALDGIRGESADRQVTIYLPASYRGDQARRYPVVYLLPGSGDRDNAFTGPLANLQASADRLGSAAGFSSPIVVAPNALPPIAGNDSNATAWEKFIAEDLVAFIDMRYRTIAGRISRGLAGYSTGGSNVLRIGMKRSGVFSSLYMMSPDLQPGANAEWLMMVESNAENLKKCYAIAIDIGSKDPSLAAARQLKEALVRLKVPHSYEEYDGDSTNRLNERIDRNLLPFFSKVLAASANPTSPAVQ